MPQLYARCEQGLSPTGLSYQPLVGTPTVNGTVPCGDSPWPASRQQRGRARTRVPPAPTPPQAADDIEEIRWPARGEELGADPDATRLGAGQPEGRGHGERLARA